MQVSLPAANRVLDQTTRHGSGLDKDGMASFTRDTGISRSPATCVLSITCVPLVCWCFAALFPILGRQLPMKADRAYTRRCLEVSSGTGTVQTVLQSIAKCPSCQPSKWLVSQLAGTSVDESIRARAFRLRMHMTPICSACMWYGRSPVHVRCSPAACSPGPYRAGAQGALVHMQRAQSLRKYACCGRPATRLASAGKFTTCAGWVRSNDRAHGYDKRPPNEL